MIAQQPPPGKSIGSNRVSGSDCALLFYQGPPSLQRAVEEASAKGGATGLKDVQVTYVTWPGITMLLLLPLGPVNCVDVEGTPVK
jgi:hypothetical protein